MAGKRKRETTEPEAILLSRTANSQKRYFVKWKGVSIEDATWEDADTLNAPELVKQFEDVEHTIRRDYRNVESEESEIPLSCTKLLDVRVNEVC
jgi:hypothetical protein